jgi:hypothetical protein
MTTIVAHLIIGEMSSDGLFLDSSHEQSKINADVMDINGFSCPSFLEHHTKTVLAAFQPAIRACDRNDQIIRSFGGNRHFSRKNCGLSCMKELDENECSGQNGQDCGQSRPGMRVQEASNPDSPNAQTKADLKTSLMCPPRTSIRAVAICPFLQQSTRRALAAERYSSKVRRVTHQR